MKKKETRGLKGVPTPETAEKMLLFEEMLQEIVKQPRQTKTRSPAPEKRKRKRKRKKGKTKKNLNPDP